MKSSVYLLAAIEGDLSAHQLEVFWQQLHGVDLTTATMIDLARVYLQVIKTGCRISA